MTLHKRTRLRVRSTVKAQITAFNQLLAQLIAKVSQIPEATNLKKHVEARAQCLTMRIVHIYSLEAHIIKRDVFYAKNGSIETAKA